MSIQKKSSFTQQEIDFEDSPLFFPNGFEKIFLLIYFVMLPYIVGILFLFVYVANLKVELFVSLNTDSSFILTWAIGYEIMAVLILIYIFASAINFSKKNTNTKDQFIIP